MYNNERKEQYLRDILSDKKNARNIEKYFENVSDYEAGLGKDASAFSLPEIMLYYKSMQSHSLDYLLLVNSELRRYTQYCCSHGIETNENHYDELNAELISLCLNQHLQDQKFISKHDLEQLILTLANPDEEYVLRAFYEGVSKNGPEDVYYMTTDRINGNCLHLQSGRIIEVSDSLIRTIKESCNTYVYYSGDNQYEFLLDPGAIKRRHNAREPYKANRVIIDRRINSVLDRVRTNQKEAAALTLKTIRDAGRIEMLKAFMRNDAERDPYTCYLNHKAEIEERYGVVHTVATFISRYNNYLV